MKKRQSSLHMADERHAYGSIKYVKGTQTTYYEAQSQENAQLRPDYRHYLKKALSSSPMLMNSKNVNSILRIISAEARVNQVIVTTNAENGKYVYDFNVISKNDLIDDSYPYGVCSVDEQIPTTVGIPTQRVSEGENWKYWDGEKFVIADWVQSKGYWYYLRADGYMETGWLYLGRKRYYLKTKAEDTEGTGHYGYMMSHRWWMIDDTWYYFHTEGSMLIDGWRMDEAQKKWYYCGSDGKMATLQIVSWKGDKYYVGKDGAMVENVEVIDPETGTKYQADEHGKCTKVGDRVEMDIPTYYQNDYPSDYFAYKNKGGKPISKAGCGPTSMAMVISYLTGTVATPPEVATWGANYYVPSQGTSHSLIPNAAAHWNLNVSRYLLNQILSMEN